jgi:hypothetical protein
MSNTKNLMQIFETVFKDLQTLELTRDHERELTKEEKEHYKVLNKIFDLCRTSPYFLEPSLNEDGSINFDLVTPGWIKSMLKDTGSTSRDLAGGVNVSDSQISQWLSGARNPSGAAQAAIFYYFKNLNN